MIEDKYIDVLEKLTEGTQKGKVIWTQTSSSTKYQTRLGSSTITIDSWLSGDTLEHNCEVVFFNSEGNPVKHLRFEEYEEDYNYIYDIYCIIKNKYLKEDETLDDIMRHLL